MPYLSPRMVAKAARTLFGTGHSEALVFFFLKAQGASTENWIRISSSNTPPEGLLKIAGQPDGFDDLVKLNVDAFQDSKSGAAHIDGMPTRPGARGSLDGYSMYFPITEEAQYILRKYDCNRNAVYSNIIGGRSEQNKDRKASRDDIFELRNSEVGGHGKELRLKPGYAFSAYWYYGPDPATPMRVPLRPLAVWMFRTAELPAGVSIDELAKQTITLLNITPEELHFIFDTEYEFSLPAEELTDSFNLKAYFEGLCLPRDKIEVIKPAISEKHLGIDKVTWEFKAEALGLSKHRDTELPQVCAKSLTDSGERNLLMFGAPRTGKSYLAMHVAAEFLGISRDELLADRRFSRVQFHQGWTYGDFIRKILPVPAEGGGLRFSRANGKFLEHCQRNPEGRSVFVIEELNRAPLSNVFGEAFQVIEVGYRGVPIDLPGALAEDTIKHLIVPKDLLLLATANDLDKSTLPLDFAFLSRFCVVECPVRYDITCQILSNAEGWTTDLAESFVMLLHNAEAITGYPVGHASFYGIGPPSAILSWYRTRLRPALLLYLTKYRKEDLDRVDALFFGWRDK